MNKPNLQAMLGGLRMGWRSIKLGVQAFPNPHLMKIRFMQVRVCVRVFFKGLVGGGSGSTSTEKPLTPSEQ